VIEEPEEHAGDAPFAVDAEQGMHIHRPRPLHGVREILIEIAVVVVGIVIALAGEQALEALHWRREAEVGEAALKAAYPREVDNAALREAQNPCIEQRLASLSSILRQASESGRLPPITTIGHPPFKPWTIGAWDVLVANQTVSHLSRGKMFAYIRIAQTTAFLSALGDREEQQWATLDSMAGPGRRLSDVEAEQLRTALAEASNSNRHMRTSGGSLRDAVKATGLVDSSVFVDAVRRAAIDKHNAAICRTIAASSTAAPS
jgi:hypothetical protein